MYSKPINTARDTRLGYIYFMDQEHPLANRQGKVYLHRHVVSVKIGRWIGTNEFVHHIDGNRENNDPSNLALHTRSSHAKEHQILLGRIIRPIKCKTCGKDFTPKTSRIKFCSTKCSGTKSRRFEISKDELERMVWEMPTTKIAKIYGVTDNAIAKRCRLFGIEKPPRGFWSKRS
jgi:predicted Zn-ribbon and HTH transcriptional regulator